MKKIISFIITLSVILSAGLFIGCAKTSVDIEGFRFTYEKNSAQKITSENQEFITLKLNVKNTTSEVKNIISDDFVLKQGDNIVSDEVFFGNNIIDQMDNESLEAMNDEDMVIHIKTISNIGGEYQLYYRDSKLLNFKL